MRIEEELIPDDSTSLGGLVSLIIASLAAALALYNVVNQPFTDAELESFVDTWEPEVLGGLVFLGVFALGSLVCALVAFFMRSLSRKLFLAASVVFVLAIILEVTALNILTNRAEKAAGHALSWSPLG